MPEDAHPALPPDSEALARFLTLGMSLNYQRNSYALWRACAVAHGDPRTGWVFDPQAAADADLADLGEALLRHRVALQPNKHPQIWRANARGLVRHADGQVREMFVRCGHAIPEILAFIQARRADFPYLCGPKIGNYWLYVMSQYMAWPLTGRDALSIAPDRHVIAASRQLGLLAADAPARPLELAETWRGVLADTPLSPIDLHTPLWLWSRLGCPPIEVGS